MKRYTVLFLSLLLMSPLLYAQRNDCRKFHLYSDCNANPGPRFKYDGQSRSNIIGIGDELIYSLVLYESKQYSINFCTSPDFEPIHIKFMNAETDEVFYDNKSDEFIQTLTLNIDHTQRLKIFVEVLAKDMSEEDKLEYLGCLGMMIQSKKIDI